METNNSIEVTKQLVKDGKISQEIAETIFPQLKESEDERIRKSLIKSYTNQHSSNFPTVDGFTREQILAWLEKQGEQNQITFNDAHIIDSALNDYCCKQYSALHKENGGVLSFARLQHLAMDIYGWCEKQNLANSEKTCKVKPEFKVGDKIKYAGQPDILAEKIIAIRNDAYYFSEVVSLPFVEQDKWELVGQEPADKVEQNPAWSEEDEKMFEFWNLYYEHKVGDMPNKDVVENLEKFRDWLISLKSRVQLKSKSEWSEEDEKNFTTASVFIKNTSLKDVDEIKATLITWLKSLKERYTWKPSDEQLEALKKTCDKHLEPLDKIK